VTAWLPGQVPFCAVCGEHLVREPAQYTCPMCDEQKPCPAGTKWSSTPLGGPGRWMGPRVDEQGGAA
jgi:hypothetical protein